MSGLRPLAGLRVAELDHSPALAVCGMYLAGLGAELTDFAAAERGADSALADYLGADKRAAAEPFDPREAGAYDILLCTRPPAELPAHVIAVVVSPFGRTGPRAGWQGGDFLAQAASGLMSLIGDADDAPLAMGGHQIEYTAGVAAFTATMVALRARDRDGLGQIVETSLFETAAYIEWKGRMYQQAGNELRRGDRSGPIVTRCADGYFGFYYREIDWPAILRVFGSARLSDPRFATHADRSANQDELIAVLDELSRDLRRDELYRRLQAERVPVGPVFDAADLLGSPQYAERAFFTPLGGDGVRPELPVTFNGARSAGPPALPPHRPNDSVRGETSE
ncbi:CoA transferase [Nocardia harenae]|uniref:CoA transferase n=1 Tax=Nocardia harenae TaxID=358707 RepID=UPI0008320112|nr:CoA transferase [Nocardia harenae]